MTYLELLQMIKDETQPDEVTYRGDTYIWSDADRSYHCGHKWLVEEMGEVMTDHEFCDLDIIDKPKEKEESIPVEWIQKWILSREKYDDSVEDMLEKWKEENE